MNQDYRSFFHPHSVLRAVIDAGLEGKAGIMHTTSEAPQALRLDIGCYAVFGGKANTTDAQNLIASTRRGQEMVYAGSQWKQHILSAFPAAVDASMITFLPGLACLEASRKHALALHRDYQIRTLSPADHLPAHLTPHGFQAQPKKDDFFKHGFGMVAVKDDRIVAQTTTYAVSSDKAEIAIATDTQHRNKGLAASLAGSMVLECAKRGLEPHWSASNPVSQRLARRIGFVDHARCRVLAIKSPISQAG